MRELCAGARGALRAVQVPAGCRGGLTLAPAEHAPTQWLELIRSHWGGVEIRNHWRRDAIMGEDRSRTRNPNALASLALLRNVLLALLADHFPGNGAK